MIFLANVLVMNGGSTFLVRACSEMKKRNIPVAVILLRRAVDSELMCELQNCATILHLDQFMLDRGVCFKSHSSIFGFINWKKLGRALESYGQIIHVMGVFGMFFGTRLCKMLPKYKLTAGVYHQNEFMYQNIDFYFAKKNSLIFKNIPAENIIFFNESSKKNYERFFSNNYAKSLVLPIGINIKDDETVYFDAKSYKIVSIGNLVEFKKYNEHIIRSLPALLLKYPAISYSIYGVGANEKKLRDLVAELGLEKVVVFEGAIEYARFHAVLKGSALFVGSGTSLLEAAAAGIPSLIGIESIEKAETYGFISEIEGLSYNENVEYIPKKQIQETIDKFFASRPLQESLSEKCKIKAREFSIEKTVSGMLEQSYININFDLPQLKSSRVLMMFSFLNMFFSEKIFGNRHFSQRRNQSY